MKKITVLLMVCGWMVSMHTAAQGGGTFSSLGAGLSMGTTGIDAELVTSLHPKWMLRGGVSALAVDFTAKMNLYDHGKEYANRTDINGEVRMVNSKILLDFYPTRSAFFVSGGFYLGNRAIAKLNGKSDRDLKWDGYIIPAEHGRIEAEVRASVFKPYAAIGYGRAIPVRRVGFRMELGAMVQGKPDIYDRHGTNLGKADINRPEFSHTLQKWVVYPVLSFRLTGRIL
ncbi:hypothetical protein TFKS16_1249 [Tannerella forsythia KS16]|nr:hypothetical protein [Tannerella forsythia]OLQ21750.1 hypothetical protein BGK60_05435 [Tannerella forsythia]PDP43691.1 hypothetical protein CLI86_06940 [Tannerella forsythia]SCQ19957.1 hypothetical protein TFUB20_00873 [Tannerella forsythia]BAR48404.1 hypothetical protein TF3313_0844 [Tannerella forsythia 3313]BAR51516.1 hypothetical protein TFKS16_1249 [Tannerella forsythia KS16]